MAPEKVTLPPVRLAVATALPAPLAVASVHAPVVTVPPPRLIVVVVVPAFAPLVEAVRLPMSRVPVSKLKTLTRSAFRFCVPIDTVENLRSALCPVTSKVFWLPARATEVVAVPVPMLKAAAELPSAARTVTLPLPSRKVIEPRSRAPVPILTVLTLRVFETEPSFSKFT